MNHPATCPICGGIVVDGYSPAQAWNAMVCYVDHGELRVEPRAGGAVDVVVALEREDE